MYRPTSPNDRCELVYVGCAGWSLPRAEQPRFPPEGTHLQRYSARLPAVEINSSFYRPHRPSTYARWADAVPEGFRFSVKLPRAITHTARLAGAEGPLQGFLAEVSSLGPKLGCLLVQLPPSLSFTTTTAAAFFHALRERYVGPVACEPRHPSWFAKPADALLVEHQIARVAADPARAPGAGDPGGWTGLTYFRLHGSPRVYYSEYPASALSGYALAVAEAARRGPTWCIFDNTAAGAATPNALDLVEMLHRGAE